MPDAGVAAGVVPDPQLPNTDRPDHVVVVQQHQLVGLYLWDAEGRGSTGNLTILNNRETQ